MELPRPVFESITRSAGLRLEPRRDEHRKAKRIPLQQKTVIVPLDGRKQYTPLNVRIRDLSARSVGLLSSQALTGGSRFALHLQDASGREYWVECQVQRCHSTGGPSFVLGAVFQGIMDTAPVVAQEAAPPRPARATPVPQRRTTPPRQPAVPSKPPAQSMESEMARIRRAILDEDKPLKRAG